MQAVPNQQERIEAIRARLDFVVKSAQNKGANSLYSLPSTGKKIDFKKQKNGWKLSRLIWRVGELQLEECLGNMLKTIDLITDDALLIYSFVWTLGRIGTKVESELVQKILAQHPQDQRIVAVCCQSLLLLDPENEKQRSFIQSFIPKTINKQKYHQIKDEIQHLLTDERANDWLYWFYLNYWTAAPIASILLEVLATIPLKGNYFRAVRKILKAAEHFEDLPTMALLYMRIYRASTYSNVKLNYWEYINGEWQRTKGKKYAIVNQGNRYYREPLEAELAKDSSEFGFTKKTQSYFKNRFIRTLFRLGDAAHPTFTRLATEYLLLVKAADAGRERREQIYHYIQNEQTGRWDYVSSFLYYPTHAYDIPLHRLLHHQLPHLNLNARNASVSSKAAIPSFDGIKRSELYPELWDQAASDVLNLLANSQVAVIQHFAVRIYEDNPHFAAQITAAQLSKMFTLPFTKTNQIALAILQNNYAKFEAATSVFLAMLDCQLEVANRIAFDWMNARKTQLLTQLAVVLQLIQHNKKTVNNWIAMAIAASTSAQKASLFDKLLTHLLTQKTEESLDQLLGFMANHLQEVSTNCSPKQIKDLLHHDSTDLQLYAARLLKNHAQGIEHFPYEFLLCLMESEHPKVRAAGIELFGQLPETSLYEQQLAIVSFCVSPVAAVRAAVAPIALKISQQYTDFGQELTTTLCDVLLLRGKANAVHDSIADLLTQAPMQPFLKQLPSQLVWRLLRSKKFPAQQVGFVSLQAKSTPQSIDLAAILELGKHEWIDIRQWAFKAIQAQKAMVVYEAATSMSLLETDWEDSRTFMMNFMAQTFQARDWTPDILVRICDSTRPDVQAFGLQLMERYFKPENAIKFLLQLSQHPATNMQRRAASWLAEHASNNPTLIAQLQPFFITLLSQINKGRTAKNLVFDFLEKEALNSLAVAELVLPILERIVLTVAVVDKAKCILLLNRIRRKYPHLTMKLRASSRANAAC